MEIIELPYSPFSGTQCTQPTRNSYSTAMRAPNEDHQDTMERDTPRAFKVSHSISSIGQSVAPKRKSIFETTTQEEVMKITGKLFFIKIICGFHFCTKLKNVTKKYLQTLKF